MNRNREQLIEEIAVAVACLLGAAAVILAGAALAHLLRVVLP